MSETELTTAELNAAAEVSPSDDANAPAPKPKVPQPELYRIRITYARDGGLRYVSHLDMQMVWERTLRRAHTPLAYTQGFNPRPRLHLGCALPLGFASRCELTDFWLQYPPQTPCPDLDALAQDIRAAAPPGLTLLSITQEPLQSPALQTQVIAAEYQATPLDALDDPSLAQSVQSLLDAPSLPRERRGKAYDLRPLIEALELNAENSAFPVITMRLTAKEGATGRPEEVLTALGMDFTAFRVERTAILLKE